MKKLLSLSAFLVLSVGAASAEELVLLDATEYFIPPMCFGCDIGVMTASPPSEEPKVEVQVVQRKRSRQDQKQVSSSNQNPF